MSTLEPTLDAMRQAWMALAERFRAYELVLPGSPTFVCLASDCPTHCCKRFSVSLNDHEVERMERASGLQPVQFLESENGEPITLPLAQPYLLARREGRCALLAEDLYCGQYEGRPDACRLYPHFVLFADPASGRLTHADIGGMQRSIAAALAGDPDAGPYTVILIRHLECPGFAGPPLDEEAWWALLAETARLQYSEAGGVPWIVS